MRGPCLSHYFGLSSKIRDKSLFMRELMRVTNLLKGYEKVKHESPGAIFILIRMRDDERKIYDFFSFSTDIF